jgi:hypothetical protein
LKARHIRHLLLAIATPALITACGGGEPQALSPQFLSPQKFAAAQHAQARASSVTPAEAAEQLLNAAETYYPDYFPGHKVTATYGPFAYRFYPENDVYVGVAVTASGTVYVQNGVYVAGAGRGTIDAPGFRGTVNDFLPGLVIGPG